MANDTITKRDIEQAKRKAEYEKHSTIAYWNKLLRHPFLILLILLFYGYIIYSKPSAIWSLPALPLFGLLRYHILKKGTG